MPEFEYAAIQTELKAGESGKVMVGLRNTGTTAVNYGVSGDADWVRPFFADGTVGAEQEGSTSLFIDATQLKAIPFNEFWENRSLLP